MLLKILWPVYCKIASSCISVNLIVQNNTFKVGHDATGKLNGVNVTYYREVGYLRNPGGGDYLYGYLDNGNYNYIFLAQWIKIPEILILFRLLREDCSLVVLELSTWSSSDVSDVNGEQEI